MESLWDSFKSNDLPDRLGPMTVKELRQGLRRGIFVSSFLAIHILAIWSIIMEVQMLEQENFHRPSNISNLFLTFIGQFWTVTGAICMILLPLSGFGMINEELEGKNHELLLMTPLSRKKVVRGKFLALWGLILLTFVSLTPYIIARYLYGGIEMLESLIASVTILLISGCMAAGVIGASSYRHIAGRIAILCLYTGSLLTCLLAVVIPVPTMPVTLKGTGLIFLINMLMITFSVVTLGLALARSRLLLSIPPEETSPSRVIIGFLILLPIATFLSGLFTCGFGTGIAPVFIALIGWKMKDDIP